MPRGRAVIGTGLQPLPQIADPLQSVGALMNLASGMQGMEDQGKARADREALNTALKDAGGDYGAAAKSLRSQGRATIAADLDAKAAAQRKATQDNLWAVQDRAATGFKTATGYLQAVEDASPETRAQRYAEIRPQLLQALPEGFHQHVPEQYDAKFVTEAIPFGMSVSEAAGRRAEAVRVLNEKSARAKGALDQDNAVLEALVPWMKDIDNYQELEEAVQTAERIYGASPAVRARLGDVPQGPFDAKTRLAITNRLKPESMPTTIQAAILKAHEAGDSKGVTTLMNLHRQYQAASEGAKSTATPEGIAAVLANPAIWNDLPPTLRGDMLPSLARQGFDFAATAKSMTATQRGQIDRWKTDEISALDKERRDKGMSDAEYTAAVARINESYRVQMGGNAQGNGPKTPGTPPGTGTSALTARDKTLPPDRRSTAAAGKVLKATTDAITKAGKSFTMDKATGKPIVTDGKGRRILVDSADEKGIRGTVVD